MSGLFIYDGDCGFCTSAAAWLMARVDDGVRVEPWQSLDMTQFGLSDADGQISSWWVPEQGVPQGGAQGIGTALRTSNSQWLRLCGAIITFAPIRPLAKVVYSIVVRFRHRLPGSTDACRIYRRD